MSRFLSAVCATFFCATLFSVIPPSAHAAVLIEQRFDQADYPGYGWDFTPTNDPTGITPTTTVVTSNPGDFLRVTVSSTDASYQTHGIVGDIPADQLTLLSPDTTYDVSIRVRVVSVDNGSTNTIPPRVILRIGDAEFDTDSDLRGIDLDEWITVTGTITTGSVISTTDNRSLRLQAQFRSQSGLSGSRTITMDYDDFEITTIPEPGSFGLIATGGLLLLGGRWRRKSLRCIAVRVPLLVLGLAGIAQADPDADVDKLPWAPPILEHAQTIEINNERNIVRLQEGKDYRLEIVEPISAPGGVIVRARGARHIVLVGGEINIPHQGAYGSKLSGSNLSFNDRRRGLYIKNWAGTLHVEGLWIHGDDLAEGINLGTTYPDAVAQLQNLRIEGVVSRPEEKAVNYSYVHHPDVLQTWAGPNRLCVARLTGTSEYQGFMIAPKDHGEQMEYLDLRQVNLRGIGVEGGRYLLWRKGENRGVGDDYVADAHIEDVWVQPGEVHDPKIPVLWPNRDISSFWSAVRFGTPEGGDFVSKGTVGMDYISPGYAEADQPQ